MTAHISLLVINVYKCVYDENKSWILSFCTFFPERVLSSYYYWNSNVQWQSNDQNCFYFFNKQCSMRGHVILLIQATSGTDWVEHFYIKGTNTQPRVALWGLILWLVRTHRQVWSPRIPHLLKGHSEYNTKHGIMGAVSIATNGGITTMRDGVCTCERKRGTLW